MITIIDYGLGNVLAFKNIYNRLKIPVIIAKTSNDLVGATKLILPGVGSFDYAMKKLKMSGMCQSIEQLVLEDKIPLLGVCVGMQMLAKSSDEGKLPGLGWVDAKVRKFSMLNNSILPHMGWNGVRQKAYNGLFKNMQDEANFYFLHSYYFDAFKESDIIGVSDYGVNFTCAIQSGNIFGVQFHPEKSHHFGMQLLKNYSDI
jgi:imidazole glycerol-phosphate synthase subunit HisH